MTKKGATAFIDSIPTTTNNHLVSVGESLMKYFRDDAEKTMKANHERYLREKGEQQQEVKH